MNQGYTMLSNASADDIGSRAAAAWDKHLNDNPELKAAYVKIIRRRSEVERCIKWVLLDESMMERMIDKIEEIYDQREVPGSVQERQSD